MFRKLQIAVEYQDFGSESTRCVSSLAADFGLRGGRQKRAEETGQYSVFTYPFGRSRRRAEAKADEINEYIRQATSLPVGAYVIPPANRALSLAAEFFLLLRWTLNNPHDPDRAYNLYILRNDLQTFWRWLLPFWRCECGGYTRVFWKFRDPHYRDGKWVGPDDCLPF